MDFTANGKWVEAVAPVAEKTGIPLEAINLPEERHARQIWERDAVLVRPDDHVCWRAPVGEKLEDVDFEHVFKIVSGNAQATPSTRHGALEISAEREPFTGTIGNVDRDSVDHMAVFQN